MPMTSCPLCLTNHTPGKPCATKCSKCGALHRRPIGDGEVNCCATCWRAATVREVAPSHLTPQSREALAATFARIGDATDLAVARSRATGHQEAADALELQRRPKVPEQGSLPF